ncbi:hypothetical protein GGR27_003337 [Lewinella antarctica]|uniref:Uncharacterized protein n=1 Tax=Neolewinella antarctica TaxID=442734 RepID=A0ABX0XES3_9BACT|nr:hypothetical protein [Neolewinella antarctica]
MRKSILLVGRIQAEMMTDTVAAMAGLTRKAGPAMQL